MDLRAELMAAMAGTTEDERAWIPLRRGVVEAVVAQLTVMEQVQKLLLAFTPGVVVSEPVVREPLVKKSGVRYERDNDAVRAAAIAEIRRLAKDGVAPSLNEFDERRNPSVPKAAALWSRLGVGYRVLVEEAGLQASPMGRRKAVPTKVVAPTTGTAPHAHTNGTA